MSPERIGGRHALGEQRKTGQMDVRRDEDHPGEERESDGQDQRVDSCRTITVGVTSAHEQQQPADESRIDGQVDRIARRRKSDVHTEELRVAVRVQIAEEEQGLADHEQAPCPAGVGAVQPHPDRDRDGRGEPENVDQRAAALDGRYQQVGGRQDPACDQIPEPRAITHAVHPVVGFMRRTPRDAQAVDRTCSRPGRARRSADRSQPACSLP